MPEVVFIESLETHTARPRVLFASAERYPMLCVLHGAAPKLTTNLLISEKVCICRGAYLS